MNDLWGVVVFLGICAVVWAWTVIDAEGKRRETAAYRAIAEAEHTDDAAFDRMHGGGW